MANDEPHFECVQFHLPVFVMFVSRINFDFNFEAGLALIVEVWKESIWLDYDKDRLAAKTYVLDSYTQLFFGVIFK